MSESESESENAKKLNRDVDYNPHVETMKWGGAARVSAGLASVSLLALGQKLKGPTQGIARFLAVSLGLRALFNRDLTQALGTLLSPTIHLHRELVINAPADEVARFWSTLENYPRFMSFVRKVSASDSGNMLWEVVGPGGVPVRWESFIKSWWPARTISWVTAPGSAIFNSGTVLVQPLKYDCCKVWIELSYALRAGSLGYAFLRILGFDPRDRITHDLAVMKSLIEKEWQAKDRENSLPLTS